MIKSIPRLLLFDIDGTLTKSKHIQLGNHHASSLLEALSIVFKQNFGRNNVNFAGGTDPSISADVLSSYNITEKNCVNYHENIAKALRILPDLARKGVSEGRYNWHILPNVNELLEALSKRKDVKIGLLTGNVQDVALIKLETAGVKKHYFMEDGLKSLIGAFGSDSGDRKKLVEVAKERYSKYLGISKIEPNDVVVIGDTPKDVLCAHANRSPCVAVTTGIYKKDELQSADCVLEDGFVDIPKSIKALLETQFNKA